MRSIEEIEAAIETLPRDQLRRLVTRLREKLDDEWDCEIEEDARRGNLDALASEALAEYHLGRTMPFPPADAAYDISPLAPHVRRRSPA